MIIIKQVVKFIIEKLTGYQIKKIIPAPLGADLFDNIKNIININTLDVLFDVGANNGQTSRWFRNCLPNARIYSFEPVYHVFEDMKVRNGKDSNTILENIAFGNIPGQKKIKLFNECSVLNTLKDELMNTSPEAQEEIVKIDTIDHYCSRNNIERIDVLKIDTEGFEIKVLKGAEKILSEGRVSLIFCEVGFLKQNRRNTYFPDLTEFLAGYEYYFLGLYQMDSHDWAKGGYLGNALYVKKSLYNG